MIKNIIVGLCILICVSNLNAQSFIKVKGVATDIAVSPKDGSVFVVGISKNVFKYDTKYKQFKPHGNQSKNVKSIAVQPNGVVYMISTSNEVYIDVNGRWNKIPRLKTNEVDIDKSGNIRALDASGKLYKLFNGQWKKADLINRGTTGFNQVIGKDSKILYARFKDNAFKQFKSGNWTALNGKPLKIAMDDKNGDVYAVGRNKGIYKWNTSNKKWDLLEATRKDFKDVAVHNGKIWAISNNNAIYYYDKYYTSPLEEEKDYSGTYRVTITRIVADRKHADPDKTVKLFGTIGVYLEGKIKSGTIKIDPINNKKNRVWDVSKNSSIKMKEFEKRSFSYKDKDGKIFTDEYDAELEVDKIREFKIIGEAANDKLTFDIQSNLTRKRALGEDKFDWERKKVNIDKVALDSDKEFTVFHYGYGLDGSSLYIKVCFKIEKM